MNKVHLRISFWHLLMNFEKPAKSQFWENEKQLLEISSFYTCAPKSTIIWDTVPEIQSKTVILGDFLPFTPPPSPNNLNFEKMKKASGDVIILNFCSKKTWSNDVCLLRYGVWWIYFSVILGHFLLVYPPPPIPNNHWKNEKNSWRYYHFTHEYHK